MEFGAVRLPGLDRDAPAGRAKESLATGSDIAIVGIGLRLPFAETETELLTLLREGADAIRSLPAARRNDADRFFRVTGADTSSIVYGEAAYLDAIDGFDFALFKLSPKEASLLDPNQRIFLETAWRAIEDAGMGGRQLAGSRTGVFVGYGSDAEYKRMIDEAEPAAASMAMPGNVKPIIASRLSYLLDLRGPSMLVDTTCSSSLVAVHLACQSIRNGECDLAIAGGIQLHLLPVRQFEVGIESSTGRTRTFDDAADGTGTGEGAAAIVLKPLARALRDRDPVYAVIKGSAINQDGGSVGITAPNADAQADVIAEVWRQAGIPPETVGYIEAHGTGTKLGDPVELAGIRQAFARFTNRKMFCAVGSVKSNFGHLDNAAGIAGLLKATLSLKHRQLFPTLHVDRPNRAIPFVESPVYVNTRLSAWEPDMAETPLRCGVSSFGISGTNCHVLLEQAPAPERPSAPLPNRLPALLPLSARSADSLIALAGRLADYLDAHPDIRPADVCATAAVGRGHYPFRVAVAGDSLEALLQALRRMGPADVCGPVAADDATNRQADAAIDLWRREGGVDADTLAELGRLYEAGADVRWARLFEGRETARLNLPATPFERRRCWFRLPEEEGAQDAAASSLYHRLVWREEALPDAKRNNAAPIVITGTDRELIGRAAANLRAAGEPNVTESVLEANPTGDAADESASIGTYAAVFGRMLDRMNASGPRRIVLLENEVDSQGLYDSAWRLMGLLRALASETRTAPIELIVAAAGVYRVDGTERRTSPDLAALFAMGKAIHWEMPHIRARCVDYGRAASDVNGLVDALLREPETPFVYATAYRAGKRYVERVTAWDDLQRETATQWDWQTDGVYLITGGLGGIGLRVAERIAAKGAVQLALLNRTAFPPREAWGRIVADEPASGTARRIRALLDMERSGARVDVVRADVADENSLREALEMLRLRYGRVNGIVHAAGSGDGDYLTRLDETRFKAFTAAKVEGTLLLDTLTRTDEPDFFMMFSSAITLVGGVGSSCYAAANAWLDAYASIRRAAGGHMLSVGWPAWARTGLSEASEPDERKELFRLLPPERGVEAFERLLGSNAAHVLVGEWNRDSPLFELGDRLPFQLEKPFAANEKRAASQQLAAIQPAEVKLKGKGEGAAYSETERKVAQAWMEVLGYETFGVDDNFFELGGDSILISKLHTRLQEQFPDRIKIADLFSHPTIAKLTAYLQPTANTVGGEPDGNAEDMASGGERERAAGKAVDIAIVGMSVRLPDAPNLDTFWANLIDGKDSIRSYPASRQADARGFVAHFTDVPEEAVRFADGGYLDGVDGFDPGLFQISPREASLMDPNQRLFLEASWEAIEDAGYGGGKMRSSRTGVYLGYADWPVYGQYITKKFPSLIHAAGAGNTPSLIASRISYLLDLQGPAFLVDTACSSSLVAVHLACRAIRNGECEMAITGGVKACLMPVQEVFEIGIESSKRQTRAFDDDSDGTVWGEGVVALLLKPLDWAMADGDRVYAVIKGSAINQDGASAGITAPNARAQAEVIAQAWADANIDPETITYIETHGTGTKLGDPIEIDGIQQAFERYTDKKQFCAISAVKSNIGHLDSASGVAGLVKAVASLQHGQLAPTLHFDRPNRNIAFERSPVYVADRPLQWETDGAPRRCGVSSFGFSGTNCHLVLEEAPPTRRQASTATDATRWRLLALSGRSEEALHALAAQYRAYLRTSEDTLDDICVTANTGRGHYSWRLAFVFRNRRELQDQLDEFAEAKDVEDGGCSTDVYFGFHRLVTDKRETTNGLLTVAEQRQLDVRTEALLDDVRSTSADGETAARWRELARLYVSGAEVDWERLYEDWSACKARIPTYPFQHRRHWLDPAPEAGTDGVSGTAAKAAVQRMPSVTLKGLKDDVSDPFLESLGRIWGRLLGLSEIGVDDDFFELGGHSLLAIELETVLAKEGMVIDADDLYTFRTLNELARMIRDNGGEATSVERTTEQAPEHGPAYASEQEADAIAQADFKTLPNLSPAATALSLASEPAAPGLHAETLILPGVEPFNDIFYRNCFFNSTFPAVRSFGRSIAPFLANDWVAYAAADGEYTVHYTPFRPMEEVFALAGVRAETKCGSDNIVHELLDSLSVGRPSVVWVDCHDLPIRRDAYLKRHIDHTLLVFGYDRRDQLFHIVEHDRMENLSYQRRTLPFADLRRAFAGFVEQYVHTGLHEATHYTFAPAPLPGDPAADPILQWARCLNAGQGKIADSLSALDQFRADYVRLTASADRLQLHADRLLAFLNEAALAKRTEQYRLEILLPEATVEHQLLDELLADWSYVRKGMARYKYGGDFRPDAFASGAERLAQIAVRERKLHDMLAARFDAIAERT